MCHQDVQQNVCHSLTITSIPLSAVRRSYYIETHGTTWYGTDNWGSHGVRWGACTDRDRDKMRQLMTKVRLDCHPDLASLVYTTAE